MLPRANQMNRLRFQEYNSTAYKLVGLNEAL